MLQKFNSQGLGSKKFDYSMLIDANDPRGIDVGLLTRFEILNIRTHMFDRDQTGVIFSRDCLDTELKLPDGRSLHMLCNHLKSQGYGSQAANDAKRRRQTVRLAQILAGYNLATDFVIVAGDMNDDPSSAALQPLLSMNNLFDVLQLKFGGIMTNRWTYKYGKQLTRLIFCWCPSRSGTVSKMRPSSGAACSARRALRRSRRSPPTPMRHRTMLPSGRSFRYNPDGLRISFNPQPISYVLPNFAGKIV